MSGEGPSKLSFKVIYATSEDPEYPSKELNAVNPSTKGWHSDRFCSYPQELGFQLQSESKVLQIQVLSHQYMISSKIEIYMGAGSSYETAHFRRLGYLSLDSNEKSNYQARELKTVFIDHVGSFLKLVINQNHPNRMNIYSQVGIVALSLQGIPMDELDAKPITPRGGMAKPAYKNPYNDLTVDINLDPQTANKLRQLAEAKSRAIQNEDYLTAKQIKSVEQELKGMGSRLAQLDMAKSEAVASEDYDLAKDIKDQCDNLRVEIERKIRAIQIPGMKAAPAPKVVPKFAPSKDEDDYGEDDGGYGRKTSARGGMNNVDDIQVGPSASGKKLVKVEAYNPPGHDDDNDYGGNASQEDDDSNLPLMERPIRPKANVDYNDPDPALNEAAPVVPTETFAPGQHPLEGIPGCADLATPEPLNTLSREFCEQNGITRLIGDYRARCLYTKVWATREAVMNKLQQLLREEYAQDINNNATALCAILKIGAEDKIQQVLFSSVGLMDMVLKAAKGAKVPRSTIAPALDPVINQLVEKLADGNARIREGAKKGLDILSASPLVGPGAVAHHLTRPLPAKQKTAWRPVASRLAILADLVTSYGLGQSSGLNMDTILSLPKATQAFVHSNGEVRDAAKDLVVAIQKIVGTPPLEPILSALRKKQREEYEAAFEGADSKGGAGPGNKDAKGVSPPPKRTDMAHQHSTQNPGGKVPTSSAKVANEAQGYGDHKHMDHSPMKNGQRVDNGGQQDFTTCMFCGVHNGAWTENELDLHYWKDCPLLISCPSCAQIVEIAGLPEHLLDECDSKGKYSPCEVTGLAIRKNEFDDWSKSPKCRPAPENFMYCPLCLNTVEDSDDAWLDHLNNKCAKNARIHPN